MTSVAALEDRSIRAKIYDVREQRRLASPLTMRTDAGAGQIVLEGYAATFQPYDVFGGPDGGGWNEQLHNRAFDKTLSANPDVQLLVNHEGWPLARTKSGTLVLRADSHGLLVRASLDLSDPDVQRLLPKMRRKDMDEMSFAFRVRGQDWSTDYTQRLITEVNLQKGDVSVVNYGANPTTMATLMESLDAISELSSKELVELRSRVGDEKMARAMQMLRTARASKPKKTVSNFADPGYLDRSGKPAKDGSGVKRYPLNSAASVRNAAARFAQNKDRYSREQQSAITDKTQSAATKFGVKLGDDSSDSKAQLDHFDLRQGDDGRAYWVGVTADGQIAPLLVGSPAPGDSRAMGDAFGGQPQWNPVTTGDIHDGGYDKEDHDRGLTTEAPNPAAGSGPQISTASGYDPHAQAFGPVQMCSDKTNEKGNTMDADERQNRLDEFRADDDDMKANADDDMDSKTMDEDCEAKDMDEECGDDDMDEEAASRRIGDLLSLAAALESTIVTCFELAESKGDTDMRNMLSRARRQVRDLQGTNTEGPGDLDKKLNELRSEFGDPETISVADGLRALEKAGYADMMHDQVLGRRANAADPFPAV